MNGNNHREQNGNAKNITFLGFVLSRRTDLLAILAIVLSLFTILATLMVDIYHYWRGSILHIFLPEYVQLLVDNCIWNEEFYHVGVIAPITFFNTGKYDDLTVIEKLYMVVGNKRMQLYPYRIVETSRNMKHEWTCDSRKKGEFQSTNLTYVGSPLRASVKAGSALSREILFTRDPEFCSETLERCDSHSPDQYIDLDGIAEGDKTTIELRVRFLDDGIKVVRCDLELGKDATERFRTDYTITGRCNPQGESIEDFSIDTDLFAQNLPLGRPVMIDKEQENFQDYNFDVDLLQDKLRDRVRTVWKPTRTP